MLKKWWFYLLLVIVLVVLYYVLVALNVLPTYQCQNRGMGPNGPLQECQWHRGTWEVNPNIEY